MSDPADLVTPQDIANLIVNIPAKYRDYLARHCPSELIVVVCIGLKQRVLDKRVFLDALRKDFEAHEQAERESDASFTVPGCTLGQVREVDSEYWEGRTVEIVGFVRRDPGGYTLRCAHLGSVYHMRPEWLKPL